MDRCLFYPWYQVEVTRPMEVVPKGGWAPIPSGYQRLVAEFTESESVAIDKTCWDWTMPAWVITAYVDLKRSQCYNWDDLYEWMVWRRLRLVVGPGTQFLMSNGVYWNQTYWGQMKSGWLLTLSMNSIAQQCQHVLAWKRAGLFGVPSRMWAMGDDVLMRFPYDDGFLQRYMSALTTTGCIVKKEQKSREFSGFEFIGSGSDIIVRPLYPDKHKFVIQYLEPEIEQDVLLAYTLIYALDQGNWIKDFYHYCEFPVGPMQKMWAKGLGDLALFDRIPSCFKP